MSLTIAVLAFWLVGQSQFVHAASAPQSQVECNAMDRGPDEATDIYAVRNYEFRVAQLLAQSQFDVLDCMADSARAGKERFSGGAWKIHRIYSGLTDPKPYRRASEDDWKSHLARLEHWVRMNPDSITARVAWAKACIGYAWFARGNGYADSVTGSGWESSVERIERAKTILNDATKLSDKCPEWYVAMQQVLTLKGADLREEKSLLSEAVKFEPGYYYYYRMHANFLLPKWYGEEGDVARFATQSADRVGGAQGDALYFLIAVQVSCGCDQDEEFGRFAWPRLKKGFAAVERLYGVSMVNLNAYARMAVSMKDAAAARIAFDRIDTNWDEDTWLTQMKFAEYKAWAQQAAQPGNR